MIKKEVLNELANEIYANNKAKGFWDERESIPSKMANDNKFTHEEIIAVQDALTAQMLALVHSEVSEALEADRKDLMDDKLPTRSGLEVELADALIRILDMAGGLGLDIGGATVAKLAYNKSRPYKHGKKY